MPLKRKLIKVGNSRAVIIPASWLTFYQDKLGKPVTEVLLEVNNVITVAVSENTKGDNDGK